MLGIGIADIWWIWYWMYISSGGTPANGLVAENGTTALVAEDGVTYLVQEA